MNAATMKKIIRYRGNQFANRTAIINEKAAWALGKLGSRISPGPWRALRPFPETRMVSDGGSGI